MWLPKNLIPALTLFVKGVFMGVANKVPGVSGGAIAYVFGFYEELIYSFQKINKKAFSLLIYRGFSSFYCYINGRFLLFIVGGMVFSYFSVSKLLDYFLLNYELQVWALFFGMIIGSGIYLIQKYESWKLQGYISLFIGVLLGFAVNFIEPGSENHNLWFVFVCGVIGVSGMTIPGLSGSYILMLMGNYVFLLVDTVNVFGDVLQNLFRGNFIILSSTSNQEYLWVMAIFTLGSFLGLVWLSKLLGYVLLRWKKTVNALIIGFIIGSLGSVWPWKHKIYAVDHGIYLLDKFGHKIVIGFDKYLPSITQTSNQLAMVFVVLGCALVLAIEQLSKKEIKK